MSYVGRMDSPSQFYTGLVAELYDPLASEPARADDYVAALEQLGTPALELACGSGQPLLDLVERGYDVDGLDASRDMLDRCRRAARQRGLEVELHLGEMQAFALSRRYRCIFLAGASFTLLTSDDAALGALRSIRAHLEPGGSALIPLEVEDTDALRARLGVTREVSTASGDRLRFCMTEFEVSEDGRGFRHRLRYERVPVRGEPEVIERDWVRRGWSQQQFRPLMEAAGFREASFLAPEGWPAPPDASVFVALARRGSEPDQTD